MIVEALIGIILGSFTGITPGIHPNTLSAMIIASTPFLSKHFSPISITIILISMAIAHTIVNIILQHSLEYQKMIQLWQSIHHTRWF